MTNNDKAAGATNPVLNKKMQMPLLKSNSQNIMLIFGGAIVPRDLSWSRTPDIILLEGDELLSIAKEDGSKTTVTAEDAAKIFSDILSDDMDNPMSRRSVLFSDENAGRAFLGLLPDKLKPGFAWLAGLKISNVSFLTELLKVKFEGDFDTIQGWMDATGLSPFELAEALTNDPKPSDSQTETQAMMVSDSGKIVNIISQVGESTTHSAESLLVRPIGNIGNDSKNPGYIRSYSGALPFWEERIMDRFNFIRSVDPIGSESLKQSGDVVDWVVTGSSKGTPQIATVKLSEPCNIQPDQTVTLYNEKDGVSNVEVSSIEWTEDGLVGTFVCNERNSELLGTVGASGTIFQFDNNPKIGETTGVGELWSSPDTARTLVELSDSDLLSPGLTEQRKVPTDVAVAAVKERD